MQILDHEEHGALLPERVEQRQQPFEEPRLAALAGAEPGSVAGEPIAGSSGATAARTGSVSAGSPDRASGRSAATSGR